MEIHTHIHINGNHNTVNINQSNQSNESNYNYNSGNSGCGSSGCGCLSWIGLIFLIGCIAPLCNRSYPYTPTDDQKWFEPVHGSHTNQINYRKSCHLCKDELWGDILEEHIELDLDLDRIHFSDSTKEKCPICKFNLKLSKTEIKKVYSESKKSIQYIPIFFEEYPMIDNDIIPWGCRSIKWIEKQKAMNQNALIIKNEKLFKSY